jgi:hypothetical protein
VFIVREGSTVKVVTLSLCPSHLHLRFALRCVSCLVSRVIWALV